MRKLHFSIAAAAFAAAVLLAQAARADLDAVAQAMGADKLDTVQISGNGLQYGFGQAYQPGLPWPKLNLLRYTQADDYANAAHSFDYTVARADQLGGTAGAPPARVCSWRGRRDGAARV